jgi:1-acyl-sn-glycerol-3-phosphate acyltransferase
MPASSPVSSPATRRIERGDDPTNKNQSIPMVRRRFARGLLRALGWTIEGEKPVHRRYVLIAAPHTSNWDFPLMILFGWAFNISYSWMGKQSLFHKPYGWIMRQLGGIPIERGRSGSNVDAMASAFADTEELVLAVPAEGTRARAEYWKSGFYHIARVAGVPVVPSYLDFGKKRGGFGPALELSGDMTMDMNRIRSFYAPMVGLHTEKFGPVRLREESAEESPASHQGDA